MQEFMKMLNPTDILLHVINVLILFVAIRLLLYKPIRKFMNARTERVQGELDAAQAKQQAADARQAEMKDAAQQAKIDAAQAIAEGVQQGQKTGEDIVARANKQAEAIVAHAQTEARQIEADAKVAARTQVVNMAVEIAGRMLEREVKATDHQKIIDEFLTKVG